MNLEVLERLYTPGREYGILTTPEQHRRDNVTDSQRLIGRMEAFQVRLPQR